MPESESFAGLRFNADGLINVVVQRAEEGAPEGDLSALQPPTGRVLMVAWMNAEALRLTLASGEMCYWSRSRRKLWLKGESSGNRQKVVAWYRDCDGDTLLFTVQQMGGACHTGYESCFFQRLDLDGRPAPIEEVPLFDADEVYHRSAPPQPQEAAAKP